VFDGVFHGAALTPTLSRREREKLLVVFWQRALTPALSQREREPLNRNAAANVPLSLWERAGVRVLPITLQ